MHPLRKLMVLALNDLVGRGLVSLADRDGESGHVVAEIAGRSSMVLWRDIGFGELILSVWWDYDHSRHPQADLDGAARERFQTPSPLAKRQHYRRFVGATVSGWIERRTGLHIQGTGGRCLFGVYARRGARQVLAAIPDPVPAGFAPTGRFFF